MDQQEEQSYINVPIPNRGHAPSPGGSGGNIPMGPVTYPQPQKPSYVYPPVPVPVQSTAEPDPIINTQPKAGDSSHDAPEQTVPLNIPPGLESLTLLDKLIVKQKVDRLDGKTTYSVKDSQGRELYTAEEDTNNCCTRNCCGPIRTFDIKLHDATDQEVIHLSRPLACGSCWFPCCLQRLEVFAPSGQLRGTVEQKWSFCAPRFMVKDPQGNLVFRIEGPTCTYSICGDVEFKILSENGAMQVGKISKKCSGLVREAFPTADNFGISFPVDLDESMKAVMLGACFLISFMFFENNEN